MLIFKLLLILTTFTFDLVGVRPVSSRIRPYEDAQVCGSSLVRGKRVRVGCGHE
jgi:hypothetical protein